MPAFRQKPSKQTQTPVIHILDISINAQRITWTQCKVTAISRKRPEILIKLSYVVRQARLKVLLYCTDTVCYTPSASDHSAIQPRLFNHATSPSSALIKIRFGRRHQGRGGACTRNGTGKSCLWRESLGWCIKQMHAAVPIGASASSSNLRMGFNWVSINWMYWHKPYAWGSLQSVVLTGSDTEAKDWVQPAN
jgi:hypothetical protein